VKCVDRKGQGTVIVEKMCIGGKNKNETYTLVEKVHLGKRCVMPI